VARPHYHAGTVHRRQIPYWQERGWSRDGDNFTGSYQTPYGGFRGYVQQRAGQSFEFYIFAPPGELRLHSHWSCFQGRGQDWYQVHMSRRPADMSSGIMTIERLITEAIEN
jgi:hypothetical protein